MCRRANSAWTGEISQLVMRPPGARPAAIGQGRVAAEGPDLEDRAGTEGEGEQFEVAALEPADHHSRELERGPQVGGQSSR